MNFEPGMRLQGPRGTTTNGAVIVSSTFRYVRHSGENHWQWVVFGPNGVYHVYEVMCAPRTSWPDHTAEAALWRVREIAASCLHRVRALRED